MRTGDNRAIIIKNASELPLVLTPKNVADLLSVSRNTAYSLFHTEGFPSIKVGKQYRISRDRFFVWLNEADKKIA